MARLPLIAQSVRRKRIGIALTLWLELCRIAIWFLFRMGASLSLHTYRPRIRSYTLDFYAKRDYVKRLVYTSDESHKEASQFRHRTFPYYNQLTAIYARDRAIGKDTQTAADVLEEIHAEDERTTDMNEERNTFYDCEADVCLDDMDVSGTDPRGDRDQGGSSSSNKRKKKSDARDNVYASFEEAATLLGEKIEVVGDRISMSIAPEVVVQQKSEEKMEEKASTLYSALWSIEGLTDDQRYDALSKIPDHPTQMIVFFSLPSVARLEWVRRFLSYH